MPRRSARSRSRGRPDRYEAAAPAPAAVKPKKEVKQEVKEEAVEKKMLFGEGEDVMARWPGSSLFFKAKVNVVREEDDEYDVEYENGTVYTIRAKDVYKASSKVLKKAGARRSKSRGRGRSKPRTKPAPAAEEVSADEDEAAPAEAPVAATAAVDQTDAKPDPEPVKPAAKTPKPKIAKVAETPTRVSARIAAKAITEAFSEDEGEKVAKLAPNPELPDARGRKKGWSFEWVWALVFMVLGPVILVSLHTLCTKSACKLQMPVLSTAVADYLNQEAVTIVIGFSLLLTLASYIPVGATVNGHRMNGFHTLTVLLSAVPALVYYKVPLGCVGKNYFQLMGACIMFSFTDAITFYILSFWAPKSALNAKGNTGNPIVDIFNGRGVNPKVLGMDAKLSCFRFSMIGLALLNVLMVTDSIVTSGGAANPTVVVAAAFQVIYAMDAMFFEEYYFHSHDAMNSGFGWSLISSYLTFPFLPTLTTNYLLARSPVVAWYLLAGIGLMNGLGYLIFRSSETQRCEFAKDPSNPAVAHLETVTTAGSRKLIVSGWWGLVRHPNYLGELLIQWSWVLPAGRHCRL